jgi:glycosyl transferase family 87
VIAWTQPLSAQSLWWAKLAAVGLPALLLATALVLLFRPSAEMPNDFLQDYSSARNLLSGKPIYRSIQESMYEYLGRRAALAIPPNAHPPTSVLLVIPFAWTDYVLASVLWNSVSLLALGASLVIIASELSYHPSITELLWLVVAFTVWPPLWFHIMEGQFGLIVLLLMTLAWSASRRGRDAQAGCMIGLAAAIKIFPAGVLLYFILRRRWRAVIFGSLSFLLITGATLLAVGPGAYRSYFAILRFLAGYHAYARNTSLNGFFSRLFNPPLSSLLFLAGSALTLATISREATKKISDFDVEFALMLTGTLLLSTITWQHSFVVLLLPLAICSTRFAAADATSRWLLIGSWILMALPEPLLPGFSVDGPASKVQSLGILSINFYGLVAFFLVHNRFRARSRRVAVCTSMASP